MPVNRIDAELTDQQNAAAAAALATLAAALPFLIDLTAAERAALNHLGESNLAFVAKALVIAEAHPEILPASFALDAFRHDVELVDRLYAIRHAARTLCGRLDDTFLAAGSEAYGAALQVYRYAKLHHLASSALGGTVEELGRRFAHKAHRKRSGPPGWLASTPAPATAARSFGAIGRVPRPASRAMRPSEARRSSARRTVTRATENCCISASSPGIPSAKRPSSSCSRSTR